MRGRRWPGRHEGLGRFGVAHALLLVVHRRGSFCLIVEHVKTLVRVASASQASTNTRAHRSNTRAHPSSRQPRRTGKDLAFKHPQNLMILWVSDSASCRDGPRGRNSRVEARAQDELSADLPGCGRRGRALSDATLREQALEGAREGQSLRRRGSVSGTSQAGVADASSRRYSSCATCSAFLCAFVCSHI